MTREDILRMGIETDLFIYNGDDTSLTVWLIPTEEKFLKFAALVAAAEREACIALVNQGTGEATSSDALKILHMERDRISAAIRARSEQEQPR